MKKLKDTKIGALLRDKAPDVLSIVGDLLPDAGVIGVVKNVIDKVAPNDAEEIKGAVDDMSKEYLLDVQNARDNETARDIDPNASFLSKNIHEMIALLVVAGWMVSWFIKTEITQADLIGVVTLILGYLYGRSKPQK